MAGGAWPGVWMGEPWPRLQAASSGPSRSASAGRAACCRWEDYGFPISVDADGAWRQRVAQEEQVRQMPAHCLRHLTSDRVRALLQAESARPWLLGGQRPRGADAAHLRRAACLARAAAERQAAARALQDAAGLWQAAAEAAAAASGGPWPVGEPPGASQALALGLPGLPTVMGGSRMGMRQELVKSAPWMAESSGDHGRKTRGLRLEFDVCGDGGCGFAVCHAILKDDVLELHELILNGSPVRLDGELHGKVVSLCLRIV
ncbi:unnamed protein product [Prorocentrum cordatum]|uniref:Uncharacterized protein n=1 Tax=Prorocentrum cordatum TaxID=2364126 RepID=A0ABN9R6W9_9DINO|nr:unnamed protein product [Polarella glacialis]